MLCQLHTPPPMSGSPERFTVASSCDDKAEATVERIDQFLTSDLLLLDEAHLHKQQTAVQTQWSYAQKTLHLLCNQLRIDVSSSMTELKFIHLKLELNNVKAEKNTVLFLSNAL